MSWSYRFIRTNVIRKVWIIFSLVLLIVADSGCLKRKYKLKWCSTKKVNNVDMSSLRVPWQNGQPKTNTQNSTKHAEHQYQGDIQKNYFCVFQNFLFLKNINQNDRNVKRNKYIWKMWREKKNVQNKSSKEGRLFLICSFRKLPRTNILTVWAC